MKTILNLLRVRQWYKNAVVFLAIFFSGNLFSIDLVITSLLAFLALCAISSTNYIINDLHDFKLDRQNPEKKTRAIASGRIGKVNGIIIALILGVIAISLSVQIGTFFLSSILAIFILTQIYTFYLKKIILADVPWPFFE